MRKNTKDDIELQRIVEERYKAGITPQTEGEYHYVLEAPDDWLVETEMLKWLKENPNATLLEARDFLRTIMPDSPFPLTYTPEEIEELKRELMEDE